ncbi:metallophosphoesterase [Planomonospora venezuelensis]|nr:metallophosphoesterase [Planomonospora venezuelensis]
MWQPWRMPLLPVVRRTLGLGTLAGAGLATYAAWEARQYTLRRVTVPVLPAGHAPLKVLHLSDIHMAPDQRAKQEWVRGLAALEPDLVIDTGDNLAHMRAVPVVADALGRLLDVPGAYVLGSNDYYAPGMRNPLLYLLPDTGKRNTSTPQLPWPELKKRFDGAGWLDLTNGFGSLTVRDTTIAFAGVDDPHLSYDDLERVAGPADRAADLRLAVAHAPYLRVLDQFAADGYDAIIAGHTHGGQVCLPGGRALTTNCDLEPERARGLHRHPADSAPGDDGSAWLHVSAGLGTNPYVRFRVACRPEATLLTLVPAD